jgi:uncharacterized protein YciI
MDKKHYYFKLIPPRPTFPADITKEERELMDKHKTYCQQHFEAGKLLVYGPVLAPEGAFGLAILEVANEEEAQQFGENDPSVIGGLNRFTICPIFVANARGKT